MFALRSLARSTNATARIVVARGLSTQSTQALENLKMVLEGYRLANYQQELPTRFKKEIVKAAISHDEYIGVDGVERMLTNIGAAQRLSREDLKLIFTEVGGEGGEIPAQRFLQMI